MKKIKKQSKARFSNKRGCFKIENTKSKFEFKDLYLVIKDKTIISISFYDKHYYVSGKTGTKLFFNNSNINKMMRYIII